jgi:hypothetical protein
MRVALLAHYEVLRDAIESHGATYAYDQIDQPRARLNPVSK